MQPLFKIFNMKIFKLLIVFTFCSIIISNAQVVPQGYLINPPDQTVTIGTQVWMRFNLAVSNYQNGDPIEGADTQFNRNVTSPAWCYYDHNSVYNAVYGKLYNGYAVNDSRNICPIGFRVPSQVDFNTLASFIGGTANGGKLKEAGTIHWSAPNTSATNTTGFTGLPGGYMGNANSSSNINDQGYFWTITPISGGSTNYVRYLMATNSNFTESTLFVLAGGASVRCIKN